MTPKSTAPNHSGGRPGPVSRPSSRAQTAGGSETAGRRRVRPDQQPARRGDQAGQPGQEHQQGQAERQPDPADLARRAPEPHGRDDRDDHGEDQDGGLERRQAHQDHARRPIRRARPRAPAAGAAPAPVRPGPAWAAGWRRRSGTAGPGSCRPATPAATRSWPRPTAAPGGRRSRTAAADRRRSARAARRRTAAGSPAIRADRAGPWIRGPSGRATAEGSDRGARYRIPGPPPGGCQRIRRRQQRREPTGTRDRTVLERRPGCPITSSTPTITIGVSHGFFGRSSLTLANSSPVSSSSEATSTSPATER